MEYVDLAARILVGTVFAVSAIAKAFDLRGFVRSLRALVPELGRGSWACALGLVAVEAGVALALAVPDTAAPVAALWLALLLDAGFCLVLLRALRSRAAGAACRCFGQWSAETLSAKQLGRNGALAAACGAGLLAAPAANVALHAQGVMIAVFCGALGAALVVCMDDVLDLVHSPLPA